MLVLLVMFKTKDREFDPDTPVSWREFLHDYELAMAWGHSMVF